ncbi:MAG: AzlC family ABC transporter permease [Litoreibacter sp.]|nr:AzlC family ABC transporter permease [Litoreibacter sp.]
MRSTTTKSAYFQGIKAALPFIVVVTPFAMLFGVVATEAGLPLTQVMAFSALVVAGASQFTALQFMSENAPVIVVLASALAVNLRMAMYSASLTPHLGKAPGWQRVLAAYFNVDQAFLLSHTEFERAPEASVPEKMAYYFGTVTPIVPLWYLFTFVGAVIGEAIPAEYGLDFIVPITFLAMIVPALRTLAHVVAALTSILLALLLVSVPFNLGLLIAAVAAMMVGAEVERRMS